MSKFARFMMGSFVILAIVGCATSKPSEECFFTGSKDKAPLWVCDAPVEGMSIGAVGSAAKSGAGIEFMKQMAATAARVQLAQNMQVQVQNMIKQYAESTGAGSKETVDKAATSVTKQITNETLYGTKIFRSAQSPDGTMYVLVGMDKAAKAEVAETAIQSSLNNDPAAWQQFKAKNGQTELAEDIANQELPN